MHENTRVYYQYFITHILSTIIHKGSRVFSHSCTNGRSTIILAPTPPPPKLRPDQIP